MSTHAHLIPAGGRASPAAGFTEGLSAPVELDPLDATEPRPARGAQRRLAMALVLAVLRTPVREFPLIDHTHDCALLYRSAASRRLAVNAATSALPLADSRASSARRATRRAARTLQPVNTGAMSPGPYPSPVLRSTSTGCPWGLAGCSVESSQDGASVAFMGQLSSGVVMGSSNIRPYRWP
jgi:hypothetical protein